MATTRADAPTYALGHSVAEQRRLERAGAIVRPFTEQLFRACGLAPGMRVLDAGCGPGEVSMLVADLLGPEVEIVGVDRSPEVLATARAKAAARGMANARFVQADLNAFADSAPFDAVVGRLVLMYQPDPAATLRHLASLTRPGGVLAFLEIALYPSSRPNRPLLNRLVAQLAEALARSGAKVDMAGRAPLAFVDAGLTEPHARLDVFQIVGPDAEMLAWPVGVARSLLPALERCGIAAPDEIGIDTLLDRLLAEASDGETAAGPTIGGTWARVPAAC